MQTRSGYILLGLFKVDDSTLSLVEWKYLLANRTYQDLTQIDTWCIANRISINVAITKTMILRSEINANRIQHCMHCIEFNKELISYSSEERLLGVIIDRTLTWDKHVDVVLKKFNSLLYLLSRIKPFISIPMRKLFFNTYILPHLDYCCIIWGKLQPITRGETNTISEKSGNTNTRQRLYNSLERSF